MERNPVVYILSSQNRRALYVGVTTNLSRRLEEHRRGMVHHTARYNTKRLIYFESHDTAPDAIALEKQLKNWRREKKLVLINRSNPEWRDLSNEIDD
jgi:putative endonuclease